LDVSTFEILFKPLTPSGGSPVLAAVGRRVFTGHFLTVTNREAVDLTYRIEYHVSYPDPVDPNRVLTGALFLVDAGTGTGGAAGTGTDNIFAVLTEADRTGFVYQRTFTVRAERTALVALLPNLLQPNVFASPTPATEVRGYVSLHLPPRPPTFVIDPGPPRRIRLIRGGKQNGGVDATVLLNAELRSTYLPNDFVPVTVGGTTTGIPASPDFDQTTTTLTLASGAGQNELTPEPGSPLFVANTLATLGGADLSQLLQRQFAASPVERTASLVSLLSELSDSPESLAEAERVLAEIGAPVRLVSRTGGKG
jgi:hypothetical protein